MRALLVLIALLLAPLPATAAGLAGALNDEAAWRGYRARFVTGEGRVVDTANGGISHSEGQGYGMLLAVAAGDRDAFERVWGWTRANLMVRDDGLLAWRWEPDRRPAVADMNNASDGDLLVAWALTEAAEAWGEVAHHVAARRLAVELGRKLVLPRGPHGPLLLPGIAGFAAEERADGPVVNLSYWVFPALARLPLVAPEFDWAGLARNGVALAARARTGPAGLPTEWTSLKDAPRPADALPARFGYNALRIPLYLAFAGVGGAEAQAPFLALFARRDGRGLPLLEADGRPAEWLGEGGYGAVAALSACAARGERWPAALRTVRTAENYYPATLHMLALVAVRTRYPSCLRG